jgi:hypothetical protein
MAAHRVFAFAKIQQGVDRAAPAQFVVQTGQGHIVALAGELALGVHQFLGHDEQRDAFGAGMVLPSGPGILASTKWMMFSVNSWSPVEIHILWPLSR